MQIRWPSIFSLSDNLECTLVKIFGLPLGSVIGYWDFVEWECLLSQRKCAVSDWRSYKSGFGQDLRGIGSSK